MSGTGEERINKRTNTDGRGGGQQRQNLVANVQNKRGGRGGGLSGQNSNNRTPESPSTPNLPPQDEHTPLSGFNAVEIDNLLKKGFDTKAQTYKAETQPPKPGNVWGAKAGSMANGKDFWLELRRQVTTLQQTGGVSQGG